MSYVLNGKPVVLAFYKGVPFDNKYEHHLFRDFEFVKNDTGGKTSKMSMENFLSIAKSSTDNSFKFESYTMNGVFNFDFSNNLITSLVVEIPLDFINSNYLLVKGTSGEKTYYYFINSYNILNTSQTSVTIKLELELDVLATYGGDFIEEIKGKPLFTERKHCQRFSTTDSAFECCDLSLSEDVTINCKPSVVKDVYDFKLNHSTSNVSPLWCYITRTTLTLNNNEKLNSEILDIEMPTTTFCFPVVDEVTYYSPNSLAVAQTFHPKKILSTIYDNPNVVSIRFSPFPPFTEIEGLVNYTFSEGQEKVTAQFLFTNVEDSKVAVEGLVITKIYNGRNILTPFKLSETNEYVFTITKQTDVRYEYELINDSGFLPIPNETPRLTTLKDKSLEPKLLFSPCRKYEILQRNGKPYEFYPELVAIQEPLKDVYKLTTLTTSSLIDNVYSTYIKIGENENTTWYSDKLNRGLVISNDYTFPNGSDALKNFQATQQAQHTTKTIAGVIGGVLATVGGVVTQNPLLVAGGVTSSVGSISNSVSKFIDLGNTPEQLTNSGSNVFQDVCYAYETFYDNGGLLPKIVVTELTTSEQEMLLDYFYHNGYNVQRMCYFNEYLLKTNTATDNRLLTRNTFNYIKLNENLKYHLVGTSIPPIVIDKLNNIFNEGITLWTFFNVEYTNNPLYKPTWENSFEEWFMKDKYENVEIDL